MSGNSSAQLGLLNVSGIEHQIVLATGINQLAADLIMAVAIFVASLILAKALKYFLSAVAPYLVSKTNTTLDDEIVKAVNGPLQVLVVVIGAYLAIGTLELLSGSFNFWLDRLLLVAVIFIAAYLAANLVNALLNWYKHDIAPTTESDFDDVVVPFIQKIVGATIVVVALLVSLEQLKIIEITPLITGLGIIGVAFALAAKELLSNFFGAVSILTDRPYKVGDRVVIQGTEPGDVTEIGLRSTRIKTMDNRTIIVPNLKISNSRITNLAQPDSSVYFTIEVGIAYDADVSKALKIMKEVALATEGVLPDQPTDVYVTELGAFAIKIKMFVPVESYKNSWTVPDTIYRQILKRFDAEGVEIPYPITNILVKGGAAAGPMAQQPVSPIQKIQ